MENNNNSIVNTKSEILFLYESIYTIPNGDPFTGEQRYDEETKKILVSDVRIKRYVRDYLLEQKNNAGEPFFEIYVWNDVSEATGKESGSAARMKALKKKYEKDNSVKTKDIIDATKLLQKCIDVRLFGGISTEEKDSVNLTGPVQFALLNPSLNEVELRMHQNTSVFVSSVEKSRGAIGTTTVVPYAINQIHGWINPFSAKYTILTNNDVSIMLKALWESVNNANTRTKANQNSLLLLQIIYSDPNKKLYGLDRLIKIKSNENGNVEKKGEQLRSFDDFEFDFNGLFSAVSEEKVKNVLYYTETKKIKDVFEMESKKENSKFRELTLNEIKFDGEKEQ
jgi:CRISPR-associated protein Csh2